MLSDSDNDSATLPPPPPPMPQDGGGFPARTNDSGGSSIPLNHPPTANSSPASSPVLLGRMSRSTTPWHPGRSMSSAPPTPPLTDTFEPLYGSRKKSKWRRYLVITMTAVAFIIAGGFGYYLAGQREVLLKHLHEHHHHHHENVTTTHTLVSGFGESENDTEPVITTTEWYKEPQSAEIADNEVPAGDYEPEDSTEAVMSIKKTSKLPSPKVDQDLLEALMEGNHIPSNLLKRGSPGHELTPEEIQQMILNGKAVAPETESLEDLTEQDEEASPETENSPAEPVAPIQNIEELPPQQFELPPQPTEPPQPADLPPQPEELPPQPEEFPPQPTQPVEPSESPQEELPSQVTDVQPTDEIPTQPSDLPSPPTEDFPVSPLEGFPTQTAESEPEQPTEKPLQPLDSEQSPDNVPSESPPLDIPPDTPTEEAAISPEEDSVPVPEEAPPTEEPLEPTEGVSELPEDDAFAPDAFFPSEPVSEQGNEQFQPDEVLYEYDDSPIERPPQPTEPVDPSFVPVETDSFLSNEVAPFGFDDIPGEPWEPYPPSFPISEPPEWIQNLFQDSVHLDEKTFAIPEEKGQQVFSVPMEGTIPSEEGFEEFPVTEEEENALLNEDADASDFLEGPLPVDDSQGLPENLAPISGERVAESPDIAASPAFEDPSAGDAWQNALAQTDAFNNPFPDDLTQNVNQGAPQEFFNQVGSPPGVFGLNRGPQQLPLFIPFGMSPMDEVRPLQEPATIGEEPDVIQGPGGKWSGPFEGTLEEDDELKTAGQRRSAAYLAHRKAMEQALPSVREVPLSVFPSRILSKFDAQESAPVYMPINSIPPLAMATPGLLTEPVVPTLSEKFPLSPVPLLPPPSVVPVPFAPGSVPIAPGPAPISLGAPLTNPVVSLTAPAVELANNLAPVSFASLLNSASNLKAILPGSRPVAEPVAAIPATNPIISAPPALQVAPHGKSQVPSFYDTIHELSKLIQAGKDDPAKAFGETSKSLGEEMKYKAEKGYNPPPTQQYVQQPQPSPYYPIATPKPALSSANNLPAYSPVQQTQKSIPQTFQQLTQKTPVYIPPSEKVIADPYQTLVQKTPVYSAQPNQANLLPTAYKELNKYPESTPRSVPVYQYKPNGLLSSPSEPAQPAQKTSLYVLTPNNGNLQQTAYKEMNKYSESTPRPVPAYQYKPSVLSSSPSESVQPAQKTSLYVLTPNNGNLQQTAYKELNKYSESSPRPVPAYQYKPSVLSSSPSESVQPAQKTSVYMLTPNNGNLQQTAYKELNKYPESTPRPVPAYQYKPSVLSSSPSEPAQPAQKTSLYVLTPNNGNLQQTAHKELNKYPESTPSPVPVFQYKPSGLLSTINEPIQPAQKTSLYILTPNNGNVQQTAHQELNKYPESTPRPISVYQYKPSVLPSSPSEPVKPSVQKTSLYLAQPNNGNLQQTAHKELNKYPESTPSPVPIYQYKPRVSSSSHGKSEPVQVSVQEIPTYSAQPAHVNIHPKVEQKFGNYPASNPVPGNLYKSNFTQTHYPGPYQYPYQQPLYNRRFPAPYGKPANKFTSPLQNVPPSVPANHRFASGIQPHPNEGYYQHNPQPVGTPGNFSQNHYVHPSRNYPGHNQGYSGPFHGARTPSQQPLTYQNSNPATPSQPGYYRHGSDFSGRAPEAHVNHPPWKAYSPFDSQQSQSRGFNGHPAYPWNPQHVHKPLPESSRQGHLNALPNSPAKQVNKPVVQVIEKEIKPVAGLESSKKEYGTKPQHVSASPSNLLSPKTKPLAPTVLANPPSPLPASYFAATSPLAQQSNYAPEKYFTQPFPANYPASPQASVRSVGTLNKPSAPATGSTLPQSSKPFSHSPWGYIFNPSPVNGPVSPQPKTDVKPPGTVVAANKPSPTKASDPSYANSQSVPENGAHQQLLKQPSNVEPSSKPSETKIPPNIVDWSRSNQQPLIPLSNAPTTTPEKNVPLKSPAYTHSNVPSATETPSPFVLRNQALANTQPQVISHPVAPSQLLNIFQLPLKYPEGFSSPYAASSAPAQRPQSPQANAAPNSKSASVSPNANRAKTETNPNPVTAQSKTIAVDLPQPTMANTSPTIKQLLPEKNDQTPVKTSQVKPTETQSVKLFTPSKPSAETAPSTRVGIASVPNQKNLDSPLKQNQPTASSPAKHQPNTNTWSFTDGNALKNDNIFNPNTQWANLVNPFSRQYLTPQTWGEITPPRVATQDYLPWRQPVLNVPNQSKWPGPYRF